MDSILSGKGSSTEECFIDIRVNENHMVLAKIDFVAK